MPTEDNIVEEQELHRGQASGTGVEWEDSGDEERDSLQRNPVRSHF